MKTKILILTLSAILLMGLLLGCAKPMADAPMARYNLAEEAEASYDSSALYTTINKAYADDAMPDMAEPIAAPESGGGTQEAVPISGQTSRMLIRTSFVDIETKEFEAFMAALDAQIAQAGGYVEESSLRGTGLSQWNLRYATIRIRVPSANLDALEAAVTGMGNVTSQTSRTEDVTLTYVDIESRIEALKIEQASLLKLLEEDGATLDQLFAVQSRLTDVRAELSSYESRRRVLQDQVSYSTITLTIREVEIETVVKTETGGQQTSRLFSESLKGVGEFFKNMGIFIAGYSPIIVVVLIVLGLSIFLPLFFTSRTRKRRAK
ncbi:MAG: DUF4349 domain-containing protein [Clostridiales bacterium]|nr:DUF4349 domain-containing protein [Clostridiales bacterium]